MARLKIEDLPKDMRISKAEIKKVRGGGGVRKRSLITLVRGSSLNYGRILRMLRFY
jgi:hypothetical protein